MKPLDAFVAGVHRVNGTLAIVLMVWALSVVAGVPLALTVGAAIEQQLDSSLQATRVADGASADWMSEFGDHANGVAATFGPTIIGFAAVLDNVNAFVENVARPGPITATALGYVLLWTFLAGGIIDRYGSRSPTSGAGFFRACGLHFPALLRLGIFSAVVYAAIFRSLHPWLFDVLQDRLTRNVNVERTAFAIRLVMYAAFLIVLGGFNLLFDFAKVRLVSEGRASALGAFRAACRFVARYPRAAAAVYLTNVALFLFVLGVYAAVAPGAGSTGPSLWAGIVISQAYIAARIWSKLVFWGSETVLFLGLASS